MHWKECGPAIGWPLIPFPSRGLFTYHVYSCPWSWWNVYTLHHVPHVSFTCNTKTGHLCGLCLASKLRQPPRNTVNLFLKDFPCCRPFGIELCWWCWLVSVLGQSGQLCDNCHLAGWLRPAVTLNNNQLGQGSVRLLLGLHVYTSMMLLINKSQPHWKPRKCNHCSPTNLYT